MARFTESGAFAGARASAPRSCAVFPGTVGPEEGNEMAKAAWAAPVTSATLRKSCRKEILTGFGPWL